MFHTKQLGKHKVPYETDDQTALLSTEQWSKQDLEIMFARVCQSISYAAKLLEIQGYFFYGG